MNSHACCSDAAYSVAAMGEVVTQEKTIFIFLQLLLLISCNDVQGCAVCNKLPLCCHFVSLQNNQYHISGFRACLQQFWLEVRCSNKASTPGFKLQNHMFRSSSLCHWSRQIIPPLHASKWGMVIWVFTLSRLLLMVVFLFRAQLFSEL